MALGACASPMFFIVLGLISGRIADFAQWDNLEIYLPWILSGHRRLLNGDFPLWSQFQNMGEPLYAMGPGGILYPPYTACTWLVDVLRWNPRSVLSAVAVLHVGLAGLGLYVLCRSFGVRPLLAMIAAISGSMSGFGLRVGGVWIHVLPILAWSVWALWATKELIDSHRPRRAAFLVTLCLSIALAVGHIQAAVYLWLVTGLFGISYAFLRKSLQRLAWLAAAASAAALLAMPAVLPTAALLPDSDRSAAIRQEEFGVRGVAPGALRGLLLPTYGGTDGFIEVDSLITTHCGAWVVPSLLAASGLGFLVRRNRRRPRERLDAGAGEHDLASGFLLNAALAILVIVLSLGNTTPFYGWTYGIPIWSSFRWPFKLFQHAVPSLVVAGAIGLEIVARSSPHGWKRLFFPAMALIALFLWGVSPGLMTPSAIAVGVSGLLAISALGWTEATWGRALFVAMATVQAGGMLLLTHRTDHFKTYTHEVVGSFNAKQLGIDTDFRLLPLSPSIPEGEVMQALGLFHSASLNGYYALTGHRMALTSQRLRGYLPTSAEGLLPRPLVPTLLQSHLIRTFNTRYVLAARYDTTMVHFVSQLTGYRRIAETPRAIVFANDDALPRLYFATEVRPLSQDEMRRALIENRAPLTCAVVDGLARPPGAVPVGRVVHRVWEHERVAADILAPEGGFLVISMAYSPDWRALVDGKPATLRITNGAIMGLEIPRGSRSVVLTYRPSSLDRAWSLALLGSGCLVGVLLLLTSHSRRRLESVTVAATHSGDETGAQA